jgi:hypothetical protein
MINTSIFNLLPITLDLFDGEGAGAGGEAGGNQAGAVTQQASGQPATGDLSTLKFGKTDDKGGSSAAGGNTQTQADLDAEFKALIGKDGKYKDAFEKQFQSVFDRRFKNVKADQERLGKLQPLIDSLSAKYGINDGDPDKLSQAIDQDTSFWQEAAERAGFDDVAQYREFSRLQQENARFQEMQQQANAEKQIEQQVQTWAQQAKELQDSGDYEFDAFTELKNPDMQRLLQAGIPFRTAYESVHMDDIKTIIAQRTAQSTEKRVVDTVRAKGVRPKENGAAGSAGVSFNPADPRTWTDDQFKEVLRRVKAGEEIKL